MTRRSVTLMLALAALTVGWDPGAFGQLGSRRALADNGSRPIRVQLEPGNYLVLPPPERRPAAAATLQDGAFTTVVRGEEKISVPKALGQLAIFEVAPMADCDARTGSCKKPRSNSTVRLPYPDIRGLPADRDAGQVVLKGSPSGTVFVFYRVLAKPPTAPAPAERTTTLIVTPTATQAFIDGTNRGRRIQVARLRPPGGDQLPGWLCPPFCDPFIPTPPREPVFIPVHVPGVTAFDASRGVPPVKFVQSEMVVKPVRPNVPAVDTDHLPRPR